MKLKVLIASMLNIFVSCSLLPRHGAMVDYLPRDTDVPGWEIVQQYRLNNVKKIEQVAPHSSEYDPVEMVTADYSYLSDKARTVKVKIFKFRTSLDAFGLYGRERGFDSDAQFADDDTYSSGRRLFSRQGKFYVTMSNESDADPDMAALQQFLGVVRQNLKSQAGTQKLPDYILSLSDRGLSRDIIYYKAGLDAIPGARELFVTRRLVSGKRYDIVYSRIQTAFDAEQTFHRILKAGSGAYMLTKIGDLQPAVKIISPKEYLFVSYYKQWIFGVLNAENMKEVNRIIIYLYGDIRVRAANKVNGAPDM